MPNNSWIEHVKAHQAKHGVSYKQAMADAKHTYKGGSAVYVPVKIKYPLVDVNRPPPPPPRPRPRPQPDAQVLNDTMNTLNGYRR